MTGTGATSADAGIQPVKRHTPALAKAAAARERKASVGRSPLSISGMADLEIPSDDPI